MPVEQKSYIYCWFVKLKISIFLVISARRCCQLSTELNQMHLSIVKNRDFLNMFFWNKAKIERTWTRKKTYFVFLQLLCAFKSKEAEGKTTNKFLHLNVSAHLQQVYQGVLESIKRVYRNSEAKNCCTDFLREWKRRWLGC